MYGSGTGLGYLLGMPGSPGPYVDGCPLPALWYMALLLPTARVLPSSHLPGYWPLRTLPG